MELKGSRTEANLTAAFAGESQARNKYDFFASKARKEGYEQIAKLFEEPAKNEKAHAKIWLQHLNAISTTEVILLSAAEGEHFEWSKMYDDFAREAREEGFEDIAKQFENVGRIEKEHEERYRRLLENVKNNRVFRKDGEVVWICSNCGHIHVGTEAPEVCPVCSHPRAYFEVRNNNY